MKTVMDSVNEITPELLYSKRTSRVVNGRAIASDASAMRERTLVLPESGYDEQPSPVVLESPN